MSQSDVVPEERVPEERVPEGAAEIELDVVQLYAALDSSHQASLSGRLHHAHRSCHQHSERIGHLHQLAISYHFHHSQMMSPSRADFCQ